ncbi:ATP-grasp domain-containing protein, partial [Piscinibacter sakaiensis]|uniref:ATP-grasp domain-containing protein n=1 Tax=Piscinibacter sakaiensis TaxID=1547922 RepID=UPI0006B6308F
APQRFFAALDRAGLAHPAVAWQRPASATGWLRKCAASCGGDGVWREGATPVPARTGAANLPRGAQGCDPGARTDADADARTGQRSGEASEAEAEAGVYWQQELSGRPMSALALADGRRAHLVALNRLALQPTADRPFLYRGARGPVDAPALAAQARAALDALVPAFGLRGLLSLDFIDHGGRAHWLEINPRPSATMQLHDAAWPDGLLAAHARACAGRLPSSPPPAMSGLQGIDTWYAPAAGSLDARLLAPLPGALRLHDRPAPGARLRAGEPVCSIGLRAADDEALERGLADAAALLADRWEDRRPVVLSSPIPRPRPCA